MCLAEIFGYGFAQLLKMFASTFLTNAKLPCKMLPELAVWHLFNWCVWITRCVLLICTAKMYYVTQDDMRRKAVSTTAIISNRFLTFYYKAQTSDSNFLSSKVILDFSKTKWSISVLRPQSFSPEKKLLNFAWIFFAPLPTAIGKNAFYRKSFHYHCAIDITHTSI